MPSELLDQQAVDAALAALHSGWTGSTDKLSRSIEFADFPTAVEFVNRLAPRCEELDHHPDLAVRWRWVDVVLSTHSAGGVTDLDATLARTVDEVAAGLPLASS
ncbi:MAG TPA: 4a-hydroxytetrahydrobiopterin dehydratase [Jatrophihabitantaceae bacterium]|jgi:4a-hydroxytetrahydrobiopterin dehydratase|nr:4a-hydroxytetrahydrobiopterin dehydratase [Jatrophihabitantaceae bacterium]